ncbi:MAG TPA: hypothetical protein ENK52_04270 [Saprospiraceae bacterium]|nr:hypothetical protein [Saprospiraceae bacterium]
MKKEKLLLIIFLASIALLLFNSFALTEQQMKVLEKDPQVLEKFNERISEYIRVRNESCRKEVLEEANLRVDSILLAISRATKQKSLDRPPRPEKPPRPEMIQIKDTSPIQPLWEMDSIHHRK